MEYTGAMGKHACAQCLILATSRAHGCLHGNPGKSPVCSGAKRKETCTGTDATLPTGPGGCPTQEFPFSGAKWPKVYMGIWVRRHMGYRQCQSMSYLLWDPDMLLTYHPPSTSEEPTDVHPGASLKDPKTMHLEQCPGSWSTRNTQSWLRKPQGTSGLHKRLSYTSPVL